MKRNFNCRNEELPVLARFILFSLKRDLAVFTAFSPKFNDEYTTDLEAKIGAVEELVEPNSETIELKIITERLYGNLDGLSTSLNHLEGYLSLAKTKVNITSKDFGISSLRKSIQSRDVEKALKSLRTVNTNLGKYKETLITFGLNEQLETSLLAAEENIVADKQKQYEIVSKRKSMVQNNLGILNALYDQLKEIMKIGKILFKTNDPLKTQEYTFTDLKKRVRHEFNKEKGDQLAEN